VLAAAGAVHRGGVQPNACGGASLPRLAGIAHSRGAQLVVDNTFTPMAVTPGRWGADVVIHSMTKFISGASDIIAGAVCGSAGFVERLMDLHTGAEQEGGGNLAVAAAPCAS